jgi:hypothetical protein
MNTYTQIKTKNNDTYKTINTYTEIKKRIMALNTYTDIKAKEQRHTQGDKHIHTDQNKRTKAHTRR